MDPESINSVFALFDCFGSILYELLIAGFIDLVHQSDVYEALGGVVVNRGEREFISWKQRKENQILRGPKTLLGNREHKKTNHEGTEEQSYLFKRYKRTALHPPERVSHITEAT